MSRRLEIFGGARTRGALRALLAALLVVAWVGSAAPARAESAGQELGMGVSVVVVNVFYMPAKLLYALGGSLVAGGAWLFSGGDNDVARPIVDASVRGDYVIEPAHLRREKEIEFVGRTSAHSRARSSGGGEWGGGGGDDGSAGSYPEGF